jgi:two-component system, OmpR family, response regulator
VRVLVIEDEPKMAQLLRRGLTEEGYAVDVAADGLDGFGAAVSRSYDAIVLDVMLPGVSGFEVCGRLRRDGVWVPVLMLTARGAVGDRIHGLDGGADDYLTKPFHLDELFARIRALIRRGPVVRPIVLTVGDLRVDTAAHRCWRRDTEIVLTSKEYALLEMFARQPGTVLTREVLMEHCWDFAYESRSNVVDVHIRALRDKIDRPFGLASVETVRGAGYRLRADGNRNESSTP